MNAENLPASWNVERLGDVCNIVMGQSPPSATYNDEGVGMPFLQGKAEFTELFPVPTKYCTKPLRVSSKGSVLMSVRAPVGDVNLADREYTIGRGLTSISLMEGNNRFLLYSLLHRKKELEAQSYGSTFKAINKTTVTDFRIPLPPLPEQRAIALVLQTIQEAKAARQREIELERERKAALMDYLFSHGTRGEPRKQTEIGKIPESWEVVKLGEIVKKSIKDGVHQTPTYVEDGVPFITAKDIVGNKISFARCAYISPKEHKTLSNRVKPEFGDVLLTKVGTIGNVALVNENKEFSIFVQVALIKPKSGIIDSGYLLFALQSEKGQAEINRKSAQSTMRFIGVQKISTVCVPLPFLPEQAKIAEILHACDTKIAALEQEAARLDELFHAMLDELMTGKRSAVPLIDSELR